jgi:hypothetical protein
MNSEQELFHGAIHRAVVRNEGQRVETELRRLLNQIDEEYESARQGMHGFSSGAARHAFINAKMERIDGYQEKLISLVGDDEALRLILRANDKEDNESNEG